MSSESVKELKFVSSNTSSVNLVNTSICVRLFSKIVCARTGAVLVEVNNRSEVVRGYTFPYAWGIYRVEQLEYEEYPAPPPNK
jgi:hypothetical protein